MSTRRPAGRSSSERPPNRTARDVFRAAVDRVEASIGALPVRKREPAYLAYAALLDQLTSTTRPRRRTP